jgi:hypothetical protein
MPNHIVNILTISGTDELVEKIKSEISSTSEDGTIYPIDFHNIAPLPLELKNTTSPPHIISQSEYDEQESRLASGDLDGNEKEHGVYRGITQEIHDDLISKYGNADWYGWQTKTWGTKWNAYSHKVHDNGDIKFETAWSTPAKLIMILSRKYTEATFKVKFADEDLGHNVGEYTMKAGYVIEENFPEGGSEDSYMMACEIRDEWDYVSARIEEMEEEEMNDNWAQMLLRVSYNKSLFGDYPKFIWDRLQQMSVDEENYELAQKIKDYLEQEQTV